MLLALVAKRGALFDPETMLLVDHNVKSVAALVDRVYAMYLGERIAEGPTEEVMRDATVRRVYLGGSLEVALRQKADASGAALLKVSVVGLNGAGKTTLFNAISGLVPYTGAIEFAGRGLSGDSGAAIARLGIIQCPETRELFGELSVGENLEVAGLHLNKGERHAQHDWLFGLFPILKSRLGQAAATLSEKLRQSTPLTVLLAEQNVIFALPHADRVYVLEHARIVWEGAPARFADEAGRDYL